MCILVLCARCDLHIFLGRVNECFFCIIRFVYNFILSICQLNLMFAV